MYQVAPVSAIKLKRLEAEALAPDHTAPLQFQSAAMLGRDSPFQCFHMQP